MAVNDVWLQVSQDFNECLFMLWCENDVHLFEKFHSLSIAQTQLLFLLLLLFLLQLCDRSAAGQGRNLELLIEMDEFALFIFFYFIAF